jgi:hypothetical protein
MKATSKKQLFVEMTPAQAATVNGGISNIITSKHLPFAVLPQPYYYQ